MTIPHIANKEQLDMLRERFDTNWRTSFEAVRAENAELKALVKELRDALDTLSDLASSVDNSDGEYTPRCAGCQAVYDARPSDERDGWPTPRIGHHGGCAVVLAVLLVAKADKVAR